MGGIGSVFGSTGSYSKVYSIAAVGCWKSRFDILQLTENEIGQLYQVFLAADVTETRVVDTTQFTTYLKVDQNLFAGRMLSSFKKGIRFEGFVFEVWNLCTIEENDLGEMIVRSWFECTCLCELI